MLVQWEARVTTADAPDEFGVLKRLERRDEGKVELVVAATSSAEVCHQPSNQRPLLYGGPFEQGEWGVAFQLIK